MPKIMTWDSTLSSFKVKQVKDQDPWKCTDLRHSAHDGMITLMIPGEL